MGKHGPGPTHVALLLQGTGSGKPGLERRARMGPRPPPSSPDYLNRELTKRTLTSLSKHGQRAPTTRMDACGSQLGREARRGEGVDLTGETVLRFLMLPVASLRPAAGSMKDYAKDIATCRRTERSPRAARRPAHGDSGGGGRTRDEGRNRELARGGDRPAQIPCRGPLLALGQSSPASCSLSGLTLQKGAAAGRRKIATGQTQGAHVPAARHSLAEDGRQRRLARGIRRSADALRGDVTGKRAPAAPVNASNDEARMSPSAAPPRTQRAAPHLMPRRGDRHACCGRATPAPPLPAGLPRPPPSSSTANKKDSLVPRAPTLIRRCPTVRRCQAWSFHTFLLR